MKNINQFTCIVVGFLVLIAWSCKKDETTATVVPSTTISNLSNISVLSPSDNLSTDDKIILGKALFWDPILSGGKDVACATCHHPNSAYADGLDLSLGENAVGLGANRHFLTPNDVSPTKRNSQTVLNSAFNGMDEKGNYLPENAPMFWDSRAKGLEAQALGPIASFEEMRGHGYAEALALDSAVARLKQIAEYQLLFQKAFGTNQINSGNIAKAIGAFERTLMAYNSPYDKYQRGNLTAMTAQQIQGMQAFKNENCDRCHSGDMFSDYQMHVLSVPDNTKLKVSDSGLNGTYAFRTASLRNVALTAPYMHGGTFQNLTQVWTFYDNVSDGRSQNRNVAMSQVDAKVKRGGLNNNTRDQIVAFLNALTDTNFDKNIPSTVPSKLNPGGNIK
jgi:cytochrome c peroxidase